MINKNSYILFFLGILGFIAFLLVRSEIDFFAGAPIQKSRAQIENQLSNVSESLGFSTDSLQIYTYKKQHTRYFESLQDTLGKAITPKEMNLKSRHLHSWITDIGKSKSRPETLLGSSSLFDNYGLIQFMINQKGKIIRIKTSDERQNPTFIKGDSPKNIAEITVGSILNYDLRLYEFLDQEQELQTESGEQSKTDYMLPTENGEILSGLQFKWKLIKEDSEHPKWLTIILNPFVKEYEQGDVFRTEFGYNISSFSAINEFESATLSKPHQNNTDLFTLVFFGSLIVLIIVVFIVGLKNIFKGKVEWKRALFMFATVGLGVYGWQAIMFMSTFSPFYSGVVLIGTAINNLILGVVIGAYLALAYVGWEALARSQKHAQLEVVDALWQRKFFVKETGAGIIHGFAVSGVFIGLFAVGVYLFGLYYTQISGQLGYVEPSSKFPLLTMNINSWTTSWLVVFVQIVFTYSLINHWISNKWASLIVSVSISTLFVTVIGRLIATNGSLLEDYLIFIGIVAVAIATYKKYGILSVCTAWWIFLAVYLITPYWTSDSIEVAYIAWVQAFLIAGPLLYGFIAFKYGIPLSEVGDYIPEYEERIAQQLRVEREIEIARESQYKLMPPSPPKADGIDVHGFFLPSFEVGGDYFDYVLTHNADGTAQSLNMVVVDVSGKAMRAAMPAVFTSGLLLSRMKDDTPAAILSAVSEPIYSRTDKRTFITCAIANYNLQTQTMLVANAGHCKPILKRNGKAEFIQTSNPRFPLGIRPEVNYQDLKFKLKKGDFFLLYSDGLPEATNEAGERFGFDEVPALMERIDTENLSSYEIAQEIKRTVQKFSNYQLADDTTVICFKI